MGCAPSGEGPKFAAFLAGGGRCACCRDDAEPERRESSGAEAEEYVPDLGEKLALALTLRSADSIEESSPVGLESSPAGPAPNCESSSQLRPSPQGPSARIGSCAYGASAGGSQSPEIPKPSRQRSRTATRAQSPEIPCCPGNSAVEAAAAARGASTGGSHHQRSRAATQAQSLEIPCCLGNSAVEAAATACEQQLLGACEQQPRRRRVVPVHIFSVPNDLAPSPSCSLQIMIDNPTQIACCYDIEPLAIGRGSYGEVRKATRISTGAFCAIKSISNTLKSEHLRHEIGFLKLVDHPNVIRLHEIFWDETYIHLVLELCSGGDLETRTIRRGFLPEAEGAVVLQQVLRAVYYLHRQLICHRDLKSDNFLFSSDQPITKANTLKVTDFGLSCHFTRGQQLKSKVGTLSHMSPQVYARKYDQACDLWSCGVILYRLLQGRLPFEAASDSTVKAKVCNAKVPVGPNEISQDARALIGRLLKKSPGHRYTAWQALNHAWITKNAPPEQSAHPNPHFVARLCTFWSLNRFRKAALQVIVSFLSHEQLKDAHDCFMLLDANGDGVVSAADLEELLLRRLPAGESPPSCPAGGGSMKFTYTEFLAATLDRRLIQEGVCRAAFGTFDKDGDGIISKEDLREGLLLGELPRVELDQLALELDLNSDDPIGFAEFMEILGAS